LWLDRKSTPQIERVIRNIQFAAGLKHDTASKITSAAFPLKPAATYKNWLFPIVVVRKHNEICEHPMKVLELHSLDGVVPDHSDQDLCTAFDNGEVLVRRCEQTAKVRASRRRPILIVGISFRLAAS
jgi:hypothetical protein